MWFSLEADRPEQSDMHLRYHLCNIINLYRFGPEGFQHFKENQFGNR